jgi:hypothetical protein
MVRRRDNIPMRRGFLYLVAIIGADRDPPLNWLAEGYHD